MKESQIVMEFYIAKITLVNSNEFILELFHRGILLSDKTRDSETNGIATPCKIAELYNTVKLLTGLCWKVEITYREVESITINNS